MKQLGTKSARFYGLSWVLTRTLYTLLTILSVFFGGLTWMTLGGQAAVFGGLLCAVGVLLLLVPIRIRIGEAGISLRWLWVARRIPLEEVEALSFYDEVQWGRYREIGLRIELRNGVFYLPMRYHDRLAFWVRDPAKEAKLAVACLRVFKPEESTPRSGSRSLGK
jgi:hypothetical protein